MKKIIGLLIGFLVFAILVLIAWTVSQRLLVTSQKAKTIVLVPRQTLAIPEGSTLFEVQDGEVEVQGEIISRILIGKNITVNYRNKTLHDIYPVYRLRFYNAYGLMVGKINVGEPSKEEKEYLHAGEIDSTKIALEPYPLEEVLEFSSIRSKEDYSKIKWVVISHIKHEKKEVEGLKPEE